MEKKQIIGLSVGLAVVLLAGVLLSMYPAPIFPVENRACTKEAMICPDGSSVVREGPDCKFAECPASSNKSLFSQMETLVNDKYLLSSENRGAFNMVAYNDIQAQKLFEFVLKGTDTNCVVVNTVPICVGPDNVEELEIDWNSSFMFTFSNGEKSNGGYSLEVVDYIETDSQIEVIIEESSPGSNCFTTSVMTSPLLIGTLPIPAERAVIKDIIFTVEQVTSIYCE